MISFGIVGCGKFANNYIEVINSFKQACAIPMVCSRSFESYKSLNEKPTNDCIWTNSYEKLCSSKFVDVVIVCSPPESHYEIVKYALENGKHVICEKPFVFKSSEAEELKRLSDENNLCLIVDYIHLWNEFYQKIVKWKNPKELSKVQFFTTNSKTNREHHSILYDWATHEVSMINHLFGSSLPTYLKCEGNNEDLKLADKLLFSVRMDDCLCEVNIDTNSSKKSRKILAFSKDSGDSIMTCDAFYNTALEQFIADAINAIDNKVKISNVGLALKSTAMLEKLYELYQFNPRL